jgi:hypothetical protein
LQIQLAGFESLLKSCDLQRHNLAQLIFSETVEDDLVIESIEELRSEVRF